MANVVPSGVVEVVFDRGDAGQAVNRLLFVFQSPPPSRAGVFDCLRTVVRKEGGVRSLYAGVGTTLWGIMPYAGLSFFTFETLKVVYAGRILCGG